jgi:hypothetical protein
MRCHTSIVAAMILGMSTEAFTPFALTQLLVLAGFIALGVVAARG